MESAFLGHFELLEKIGAGGMGRVYKARDTRLERFVAIKLLSEATVADADRRARFVQEAKAASALNHPNIITIHEISEQDGQTFMVMELVEGKPLNELIPRKGMGLTDALRIAAQVADALTAAHAVGIVHRDLKPANIMVDQHGRVKVLDFGLAKLTAPATAAPATQDAETRTIAIEQPRTEEGVIIGSVPYMSPEQAEGRPVDARSDIFSFGAVLYEMVTGQRAFRGESRASTLAAVVEKDPQAVSEAGAGAPPELERLIARCLRKDVNRRSQNMADVKLALEELRDESESGKLVRPSPLAAATPRRWLWPAVAAACVVIAAAAVYWSYLARRGPAVTQGVNLERLSPDDDHSYSSPAISPDGKFVAYASDRSGQDELWLQQIGGAEPLQLTHSGDPIAAIQFALDGTRILYVTGSPDSGNARLMSVPTLGGQARELMSRRSAPVVSGALSPDGRQAAYIERISTGLRMMMVDIDSGREHEFPSWARTQSLVPVAAVYWTQDGRYLLCAGSKRPDARNLDEWEWFALPVAGGEPVATGAGEALRAAGLKFTVPALMAGDRVLFPGGTGERKNVWEIHMSPETWRVRGAPRQLTFGTENEYPYTLGAGGSVTVMADKLSRDLYLVPLNARTGQPTGPARRLTQDGRRKFTWPVGGAPGSAYFRVVDNSNPSYGYNAYSVNLANGQQSLVIPRFELGVSTTVSRDGGQVAYSVAEGNAYSIRVGLAGASFANARTLCAGCGRALRFSSDDRFLTYYPGPAKSDPNLKRTIHVLDVASGKESPWLEHPTESIDSISPFGEDGNWMAIVIRPPGSGGPGRRFLVPWRESPVPPSEWIEVHLPSESFNTAVAGNYFLYFQGSKMMVITFDPATRTLSEPREVKWSGPAPFKPDDTWLIRGPGVVFERQETKSSSWLLKLP